jgi:hypothetical protein
VPHVIYESRLELARLLFADFDESVRHIVAQPFLLKAYVAGSLPKQDRTMESHGWRYEVLLVVFLFVQYRRSRESIAATRNAVRQADQ